MHMELRIKASAARRRSNIRLERPGAAPAAQPSRYAHRVEVERARLHSLESR